MTLNEACAKLATLSGERAKRVFELIADLRQLEAFENANDVAIAREVIARVAAGEKTYSLEEVMKRLDAIQE